MIRRMLLLDTKARIFFFTYNNSEEYIKIKDDDGGNFRPFVVGLLFANRPS